MLLENLEEQCKSVMESCRLDKVDVEITRYGLQFFIAATLNRSRHLSMSVSQTGRTSKEAIDNAVKVLARAEALEEAMQKPITPPLSNEQPYEGGYCEKRFSGNRYVRFKRQYGRFVITAVVTKDEEGFYVLDEPMEIGPEMKKVKSLPDGTDQYQWDELGYLSGSAGIAIAKDGKIIKVKTTAVA